MRKVMRTRTVLDLVNMFNVMTYINVQLKFLIMNNQIKKKN